MHLNLILLILLVILILGNLPLAYQNHLGYCKYLAVKLKGKPCNLNRLSLVSFFADYQFIIKNMKDFEIEEVKDFVDLVSSGIFISSLTTLIAQLACLPLFLWHGAYGLRIKAKNQDKKIGNYTIMVSGFEDKEFTVIDAELNEFARIDFRGFFECLLEESELYEEVHILDKVYSTELIRKEAFEEEKLILKEKIGFFSEILQSDDMDDKLRNGCQKTVKRLEKDHERLSRALLKLTFRSSALSDRRSHSRLTNSLSFITLPSPLVRDKILRAYKNKYKKPCRFFDKDQEKPPFWIREAPEPTNIEWKHIGVSAERKHRLRILITFVSIIIILFATSLIAIPPDLGDKNSGAFVDYIYIEVVQILSHLLLNMIWRKFNKDMFKTSVILNQSVWLGILKFVILFALGEVVSLNIDDKDPIEFKINATKVIIIQACLKPILKIFGVLRFFRFLRMKWIIYKNGQRGEVGMTQEDLNQLFTKPEPPMVTLYSESVYIILLAVYSIMDNPLVTLACVVFFLNKILVDRILFFRYYSEPKFNSIQLSKRFIFYAGILLKLLCFGISRILSEMAHNPYKKESYKNRILELSIFSLLVSFCFPYGLFEDIISRRVETKFFDKRLERRESKIRLLQEGGSIFVQKSAYKGFRNIKCSRVDQA